MTNFGDQQPCSEFDQQEEVEESHTTSKRGHLTRSTPEHQENSTIQCGAAVTDFQVALSDKLEFLSSSFHADKAALKLPREFNLMKSTPKMG